MPVARELHKFNKFAWKVVISLDFSPPFSYNKGQRDNAAVIFTQGKEINHETIFIAGRWPFFQGKYALSFYLIRR